MDRNEDSDEMLRALDRLYAARVHKKEARRLYNEALDEAEAAAREVNRLRNPAVPTLEFAPGA